MKILFLCAMFCLPPGGDRERGLQLYRDGRFAEAAAAFRDAIASEGDSAELQYNLALANWRAGELAEAETAVEKYAAMARAPRPELHRGVLGVLRHDEARALQQRGEQLLAPAAVPAPNAAPGAPPAPAAEDPLAVFEAALAKATQSRDHFVQGAAAAPTPELLRNTERALRLVDELQKRIDELKQQREPQKKDQEQKDSEQKDDKESKDEPQPKDQPQPEPKPDDKGEAKQDQKQAGQAGEPPPEGAGEGKPEPKPEPAPEPKPGEADPQQAPPDPKQPPGEPGESKSAEPAPATDQPEPQPRNDAPGEVPKGKELSPEQTQRLLEQARELDQKLQQIRARASKSSRRAVERDW